MKLPRLSGCSAIALLLAHSAGAQMPSSAPPFDVAYRAWDIVTELARMNGDPAISGECGRTFRPFVIPGLRRQTRQEEAVAAAACFQAARSACTRGKLRTSADAAKKCEEFR